MTKKRSQKIILTPEAHILKKLRTKHKLSMKAAGAILGYSDSYVSHIENGRVDTPTGERLKLFLTAYGNTSERSFREQCRNWHKQETDVEAVQRLLPKLNQRDQKLIRAMVHHLLTSKD